MFTKNNSAQSVSEFVLCLGLVVAALLAVQGFVGRGLRARYKGLTDYVNQQANDQIDQENAAISGSGLSSMPSQYTPGYLEESLYSFSNITQTREYKDDGSIVEGRYSTPAEEEGELIPSTRAGSYWKIKTNAE